jgi:stringent starvation protein B
MSDASTQKPYLIRALWEWCQDQGQTPQIAVKINAQTNVPQGYDENGQIVLDVSSEATQDLVMDNEWIRFQARFGATAHQIDVPVSQVMAIFAAESGGGMGFEVSDDAPAPAVVPEPVEPVAKRTGSPLKLVK